MDDKMKNFWCSLLEEIKKIKKIKKNSSSRPVGVLFSGGTDSLLTAYAASCALGADNVSLYFVSSKLEAKGVTARAKLRAEELGLKLNILDELANPELRSNPKNRCYLCRKMRHSLCKKEPIDIWIDGTNYDDVCQGYAGRPGLQAADEDGIFHPLAAAKINKELVRALADSFNLKGALDPASPCLATRVPYGQPLDDGLLRRIGEAEEFLASLGFAGVRVRVYSPLAALVEAPPKIIDEVFRVKDIWAPRLLGMGFVAVGLDMEGYVSGRFDRVKI